MKAQGLAVGAALAVLSFVFVFNASSKMPDFEVYWRAGARALAAEPLYRPEDGHYQLKYLPTFAILAIPAGVFPLPVAKLAWFVISAALVPALLTLSLALLPTRQRAEPVLIVITLIAMAKFYGHELVLGQVNLLFATVVVLAVNMTARERFISAGLLTAVAVVIKPYAVIFLPWFAAQRAVKTLVTTSAAITAALILPAIIYGLDGSLQLHTDWWRTVTESTAPNLLNADNVSLAAMFAKWLGPLDTAVWLTLGTSMLLLTATAFVIVKRSQVPKPTGLEAALILTLIPLLSPQGWDYVFLVSTPAVMFLANYDRMLPRAMRWLMWMALAVIAFSLYDVMGRRAYAAFMALSAITVCYLIVVGALVTLRARRIA